MSDTYSNKSTAISIKSKHKNRSVLIIEQGATATVLACLPGLDAAKADALVATRAGQTGQHSIAWVKDALDEQSATQLGPFVTGRSYVYSADIAALGR